MDEITLTPGGMINEAMPMLREVKELQGRRVERTVADRKLEQIIDPQTKLLESHDDAPVGLDIWVDGLMKDYEPVEEQKPGISEAVGKMAEKTKEAIRKDFKVTAKQYNNLTFSEDSDPTIVATNDAEKSAIMEAGKLLGFKITEDEEGVRMMALKGYEVPGDLEKVIATKINVGIKNLLTDHDSMSKEGVMRRPVRRQIVAMTEHMAKTLRNG